MKTNRFENLEVWQKAHDLVLFLYPLFQDSKDFKFRNQILSAGVSVMNNIAEGFERQGNKEFVRFLYIAKGSSGEVRSMLYIARSLQYVSQQEFHQAYRASEEISRMLSGLINFLQNS